MKAFSDNNCTSQHIKTYIDYNNAHLIAQYLASKRTFSQSFDKFLQKIILVVKYVFFGFCLNIVNFLQIILLFLAKIR